MSSRILVVDDDASFREVLDAVLRDSGYEVMTAPTGSRARELLSFRGADLALVDLRLPDLEGVDLISALKSIDPDLSVVMMTAYGSIKTAVEALRRGAYDFLTKPFDLDEMKVTIKNALAIQGLYRENAALRKIVSQEKADFRDITGLSPAMSELFSHMRRIAGFDVTVLITGESGTGKELVARALHRNSGRGKGPFIAVNCAALPEALLESELFGHEKGAFTDAVAAHPGRFELAKGGTLFLDEVGDMSPLMQAKLLRVLQDGEFERVGGVVSIKSDIRLIAATNKDLPSEVAARRFREDLYYRLNVVALRLPALRERRDDIPLLAAQFLEEFGKLYGRKVESVDPEAMECLTRHSWPGNVRELKHCIEQAIILGNGESLRVEDLPESLGKPSGSAAGTGLAAFQGQAPRAGKTAALEAVEEDYILKILRECGWNQSKAAEVLGLHRNTLREKIKRYGLYPEGHDALH
jgi:DNA-binding NtrC family response regulator